LRARKQLLLPTPRGGSSKPSGKMVPATTKRALCCST
jgi:hypothetical protein